jgi:hypothetical protein
VNELQGLWILSEPETIVSAAASLVALAVLAAATIAAALRWRVPAAIWVLPALVCLLAGTVTVGLGDDTLGTLAQHTWDHQMAAVQQTAMARAPMHLGALAAACCCCAASVLAAIGNGIRPERAKLVWLRGIGPVLVGATGLAAMSATAWFSASTAAQAACLFPLLLGSLLALVLSNLTSSGTRTERVRMDAGRALTVGLALLALTLGGFGVQGLADATLAIQLADAASVSEAADLLNHAAAVDGRPLTLAALLTVLGAGLPGLATARGALFTLRSMLSAAATLPILVAITALLALTGPSEALDDRAAGGAIGQLGEGAWTRLAVQPEFDPEAAPSLTPGSCLIAEAATGWTGQQVYQSWSPAQQIEAALRDPESAHQLDRTPGCPTSPGAMDGPLSSAEHALVAMDASRSANALTGEHWFRERGRVSLLLQPAPLQTSLWQLHTKATLAQSLPFIWEMPPRIPQPEGHTPGVWNDAHAATLPVTLIEGPYPILIADGQRMRLSNGALGRDTLRLVLSIRPADQRQLVIIPRKTWTVQDMVDWCTVGLTVEHTACVIRPETPVKWAIRTHLPMPW